MHCVSTFWGPSINRKPRTESLGPSEMPWKIALEHLADAYGVTQLLAKKGTPPGLIIMWGNLHYGASLVQEWEWEVEGVKAGSYGPARCSDICKLGSHCVSLFLSGSTLPPISPFSPLRPPPFPPGRGRSVSWTGPCPGLWPLCAGVGRGGGGRCTGGGLWLTGWKLFLPVWNTGLMCGPLRFFQTQCTAENSGVSVLQEQGSGGTGRRLLGFLLP